MKTGIFLLLLANSMLLYSQNIEEICELDTYNLIAGQKTGYGNEESPQWRLYRIISEKYSSEIIEAEYFRTESITSKIYLYWILRERDWHKLAIIYEDLMNYRNFKLWFSPAQCVIYAEPIEIEYIINFNYNEIYENIDDSLPIFDYSNLPNNIYEKIYMESLSNYLLIPYLDIENIELFE